MRDLELYLQELIKEENKMVVICGESSVLGKVKHNSGQGHTLYALISLYYIYTETNHTL